MPLQHPQRSRPSVGKRRRIAPFPQMFPRFVAGASIA
jgi:hypothetical protein